VFSLSFAMKTKLPLYLALLLFAQFSSCKRADTEPEPPANSADLLPPATQTGQRTFGCLLNGQPWTPAGNPFSGPLFSSQYFNRHLSLVANRNIVSNGITTRETIQIDIDDVDSPREFSIVKKDTSFVNYQNLNTNCIFFTDRAHPARVTITRLDLVYRIVSGRFSFTLETPSCGRVEVTEGRFDSRF
jgi:hypothetical protein